MSETETVSNATPHEEKIDRSPNSTELKDLRKVDTEDIEKVDTEEKKVLRKIDRALMPILCITYGLQYYDKSMLEQAALFGLLKDLELRVGKRHSFSSSDFYLGFIAGAWPAITIA
ncbi:hypothetical protein VE03_09955 [Pseudogymnoascus sp. 23342-1-I1]|nr:hypothetical protein VE03_09955 [Pseudogymnoascus sp. 23342-1-I1]